MFCIVTAYLAMKSLFYLLGKNNNFLIYSEFFCLASSVSPIDSGISQSIQQSSKLTMTKVLEKNGRKNQIIKNIILFAGKPAKTATVSAGHVMIN